MTSLNGRGLPAEWLVLYLSKDCEVVALGKPYANILNFHSTDNHKHGALISIGQDSRGYSAGSDKEEHQNWQGETGTLRETSKPP